MTTPGKINSVLIPRPFKHEAYTLFEVLLALGIIAILLGVTVPLITNSWSNSPSEETAKAIEKSAQAAHKKAIETGEARQLRLTDSGLVGEGDIPNAQLPKGWKMQVRRFTENRFRKPQRDEIWGFNGAGICDPLELRIFTKEESIVLKFDPLTALIVTDEN
jgi:type II secretory pathway pseudopilin PulG